MKPLLALIVTLFLGQAPPPAPAPALPPANPADNGSVEGNVIWASQAAPLEGIPIYLRKNAAENSQEAQRRGVATSDSSGHFVLKDVPPGTYIVVADRRGYFRESDAEIRVIVPARGTVKSTDIRMIVGGTISGRVLDMNNLGLAGVRVSTAQAVYLQSGKRDMQDRDAGSTDDRGEFRIRALRPGSYYLRANVDVWASDSLTYYPGVRDESAAIAITVREAQDTNVSFRMEPRLKTVLTVSGTVVSAVPGVPAQSVAQIWIWTRDEGPTYYDNRADDMSNGRFEIRNIFPNVYDLIPDARDKDGNLYTSRTTVELVDRSVENLTLVAAPLVETRGRVTLNGELPAGRLENMTLGVEVVRGVGQFLAAAATPGGRNGSQAIVIDRENGEFGSGRLVPGIYKFTPGRLPPDVYLDDLRQGPVSVYSDGFEITDKPGQTLEVMLASPGGKLEGVVRNLRQEPAARATVVLIPDAARREDRRKYFNMQSDSDGKFAFRAIPPGTYKVFAWESLPANAWFNSEFLRKYETKGETVVFTKGTSSTLQLIAIPKEQEP
jgi:protocatechuate 3,4-dioxygenase beta subunit